MFAGQSLGQFVHIAVQQVDEFHHHTGAALWVHGGPSRLCRHRILYGLVYLGLISERAFRLHFAGGGVKHLGKTARCTFNMGTVHIVGQLLHGNPP